jgi:peptidyl-prolyl cis-trans isomerase C
MIAAGARLCDPDGMRISLLMVVLAASLAVACKSKTNAPGAKATGSQTVLAQVDDITITSDDLKDMLGRYANQPFALSRYSSLEKKKELLDSLIRYDVLAIEARKHGYERDPEVLRVAKDKMIRVFTQQELNDKIKPTDVPDADVEKYYKDHTSDYVRPETVRVSQIVVKDKASALKVLAAAKALPKTDMRAFRELVKAHSEDADSKGRGGDLTEIDRASTQYPAAIVASAFALKQVGDLSDPVPTDKGFTILKLTDRRPAMSRSFEDAKAEIQRRLADVMRTKKKKEFIDEARKTIKVEVFEDQLARIDVESLVLGGAARPGVDAGAMLGTRP